jgi:MoaA/NifB/PqqE/SkfB family radical SAM enzyme
MKLWIYTNYHCNLACTYCVAESTPRAPRRAVSLDFVKRLVDESQALGFEQLYFTGGEPFLLDEIYEMLAYASQRLATTVLTNGMLFNDRRMERLAEIYNDQLIVQVSLDGSAPAQHDPYRGAGSWQKTVQGMQTLREQGFRLRLSTTETPANTAHLDEICAFHLGLGIPEEDHFIRLLAKRGFSQEGLEVCKANLRPEITVNDRGVYWHPLSTDPDLMVSEQVFPLAEAVDKARAELQEILLASRAELNTFH